MSDDKSALDKLADIFGDMDESSAKKGPPALPGKKKKKPKKKRKMMANLQSSLSVFSGFLYAALATVGSEFFPLNFSMKFFQEKWYKNNEKSV